MMRSANESESESLGQNRIFHVSGGEIEIWSWSMSVIWTGCLSWIEIDSWSANPNVEL